MTMFMIQLNKFTNRDNFGDIQLSVIKLIRYDSCSLFSSYITIESLLHFFIRHGLYDNYLTLSI